MEGMTRIAALLLVVSCTSSPHYLRESEPASGTVESDRETLYQRAMTAVADVGLDIETSDAEAGLITTKWECGGMCDAKYRFRVSVGDGTYDVAIQCEGSCNDGLSPQGLIEKQQAVTAAIEGR